MAKAEIHAMSEPNKRLVNHFRKFPDYFRMFPDARFKKAKKGLCVLIFTDLKGYSHKKRNFRIFPERIGRIQHEQ